MASLPTGDGILGSCFALPGEALGTCGIRPSLSQLGALDGATDATGAVTGSRSPGCFRPWRRAPGTGRRRHHEALADLRRNRAAVRLRPCGHRFGGGLLSGDAGSVGAAPRAPAPRDRAAA